VLADSCIPLTYTDSEPTAITSSSAFTDSFSNDGVDIVIPHATLVPDDPTIHRAIIIDPERNYSATIIRKIAPAFLVFIAAIISLSVYISQRNISLSQSLLTPTTSPTNEPMRSYTVANEEDSRRVAYLANWLECPTDEQVDAYSHLIVAFSTSYTWAEDKNQCDFECSIGTSVPVCNNVINQNLVDKWRSMGKKVMVSFGGAGMGGSWLGDGNNCWDYCFGKEDQISTDLVKIVEKQNFDGIDIDYEYCFDVNGLQSGLCSQRSSLYSDAKAQTFLASLTYQLRVKLDALQVKNQYNRGRYLISHEPTDTDVSTPDSRYYQILKEDRRDDLDFLMPQMYNICNSKNTYVSV
jgi:chitinase